MEKKTKELYLRKLKEYDKIILPGVGAFPDAMKHLKETGMEEAVKEAAKTKQIFGVCLGMQLLFERGFEHEETAGLGLLKGDIVRFDPEILGSERKIPHILGQCEPLADFVSGAAGEKEGDHGYATAERTRT